jgi:hypothetical protein
MARGPYYTKHLDETLRQGVYGTQIPQLNFLYEVSSTRNPEYNVGDRVVTPDGRVFRYCYSGGACYTGRGAAFYNAIPATGIDYAANIASAAAIGDTSVEITNGSTVAQTKDGLRGGWILFKTASGSDDSALQQRYIVGNDAMGLAETGTVYLDAPLTGALTTSSYSFCMPCPYWDIRLPSGAGTVSIAGVPAAYVSAASKYFWLQTWGLCWIAPQASGPGTISCERQLYFRHDGSVDGYSVAGAGTFASEYCTDQVAGFIVDNNTEANGATLMMLQISI